MTSAREVQRLDFTTDAGQGPRALLGLIVLETDRTVEAEFRALYRNGGLDGVAHHASRIPMEATVTAETLAAKGVSRVVVPSYLFWRDHETSLAKFGEDVVAPLAGL